MNFKMMGRFIAQILALEAVFILPALCISLGNGERHAVYGFLWTLGIIAVIAGGVYLLCRKAGKLFGAREGLVCVGFSWMALSLFGCLPFWLSGTIPQFVDALFETVSGLPPPALLF